MAISLGFHIIFAAIGIAMPFFMAISHWRWLKTKEPVYLDLTKAWSKGVAMFFAAGAVSGTVLSLELRAAVAQIHGVRGPYQRAAVRMGRHGVFLEAIAWECSSMAGSPSPVGSLGRGIVVGLTGVAPACLWSAPTAG